jgi:ribonuclease P protein subunit POP4
MKITSSILQHEFIGLKGKVVQSSNSSCKGISGRVIDETLKTFTIRHKEKEKVVAKRNSVFHFILPDGSLVEIEGKALVGRPEDRIKKVVRRRW